MLAESLQVIQRPEAAAAALRGTRRALLTALTEPDSAAGLARRLGLPRQRLNYHLKALEQCGLLECVEERRKGNCTERILRATARAFVISPDALGAAASTVDRTADRLSASYIVAVAARAISEVSALDARARSENKRIATLTLDSEVRFASAESRAAFTSELTAAMAKLVAKYHDESATRGRTFRLVTIAHPAPSSDAGRVTTASPAAAAGEEQE